MIQFLGLVYDNTQVKHEPTHGLDVNGLSLLLSTKEIAVTSDDFLNEIVKKSSPILIKLWTALVLLHKIF